MAKCVRCKTEMCSFTLSERGRCNGCGFDVEDMVEILNKVLAASEIGLRQLRKWQAHLEVNDPTLETPEVIKAIKQLSAAIVGVKGEQKHERKN